MKSFFRCTCFYNNNFYVSEINKHLVYDDTQRSKEKIVQQLKLEHVNVSKIETCLLQLQNERERRKNYDCESLKRLDLIRKRYQVLHKEIFILKESFLSEQFILIVKQIKEKPHTLTNLKELDFKHLGERIYNFPVFTEEFCKLLVDEIENFEASDLPKGRPNTMNNYGVLLDELGFYENFITPLRERYLNPLCAALYPDFGGDCLDSHKAFVVSYALDTDIDLATHYDNSEITINVSLGKIFTGGSLYFGKMKDESSKTDSSYKEYIHNPCYGILHRGQHMHGAMPIDNGERYNLIIWMRSSKIRNKKCPMCDCKPVLVPSSGFADGFTEDIVNVCELI